MLRTLPILDTPQKKYDICSLVSRYSYSRRLDRVSFYPSSWLRVWQTFATPTLWGLYRNKSGVSSLAMLGIHKKDVWHVHRYGSRSRNKGIHTPSKMAQDNPEPGEWTLPRNPKIGMLWQTKPGLKHLKSQQLMVEHLISSWKSSICSINDQRSSYTPWNTDWLVTCRSFGKQFSCVFPYPCETLHNSIPSFPP